MASITTRTGKGSPLTNTEVDDNFTNLNTELGQKEVAANKGVAGGYASLDGSGKVPSTQLPSYVDDVVEGANLAAFPGSGETGKIYVALDTNKTYRWSGSSYVEISASPGSTDAVTEGGTNLYFTNARARAALSASGSLSYNSATGVFSYTQPTNVSAFTNDAGYTTTAGARSAISATGSLSYNSSTGVMSFTDAVTSVASKTGSVTLTSSDVGLGNVENKSSATIRGEITSGNVTTALGFTPLASGAKAADADLLDGYNSTAFSGPNSTIKQFFWNDLSASGTQARTYEIARLGMDYDDWNTGTGPFEVELYEAYFSRGIKKKYVIHWGFIDTYGIQLVEYSGTSGHNNFQCRIGTPVQVSGDNYYLPVFIDVRYYSQVDVRVTTNRDITTSNPPSIGTTFINSSPGAVNISDFTADSTVNFASTTAVQISGNQLLHAGNYNSYSPTLTGTGASGTWGISITGNAATATKLATARTISLTGDVTGSASFDGSANASITATVADDSHNHVISNVDGLQTALDAKQNSSTALTTSTTFGGDVSGSYNSIVVADDSHNHIISNVDGLQTALDAKQNSSTALTTSTSFGGDVSGTYNAIVVNDDSHKHTLYVVGTGTVAGTWLGSLPNVTAYYEGLSFAYKLPIAGASTTTLNINSLGALTVYFYGTTKVTTQYPVGSVINLSYSTDNGGCWYAQMYYNTTDDYRIRWQNNITAGTLIHGYQLLLEGIDGKYYPVTQGGANSTTNTVSTAEFKIGGNILYYESSTDIAANASAGASALYQGYYSSTMEYWSNRSTTAWATINQPIYLVGTINASGNFVLDNTTTTSFLTQTLPTTDDGKVYVQIGLMGNTSDTMRLNIHHPIYWYKDGAIKLFSNYSSNAATATTATNVSGGGQIDAASATITSLLSAPQLRTSNGQQLVLNAGESHGAATGQTGELVYINAEGGLQVNSSPDNWGSGWAGRKTATICNSSGVSSFPGNVGIETSSPNKSSSSTALTVNTGTAGNYSAVEWASGDTLNYHINANNSAIYHVAAGTRPWIVYTNGGERMRIGSAGQIGIGGANYGTTGQVLTSNGSSAAPSWQTTQSGGAPDFIVQSYGIV